MSQKTAEIAAMCDTVEKAAVTLAASFAASPIAGDTSITRARKNAAIEAFVLAVNAIRLAAKATE